MKRYLSLKAEGRGSTSERAMDDKDSVITDTDTAVIPQEPLSPPVLKVQKLDYYYSRWSRGWKYKKMGSHVVSEVVRSAPRKGSAGDDAWAQYCFVVVRTITKDAEGKESWAFRITVKSDYLLKVLKHVIQDVPGAVSWNMSPVEVDPKLLLAFMTQFVAYREELQVKVKRDKTAEEDKYLLQTVDVLLDYLKTDYKETIHAFEKLTSHSEITSNLLPMLFVPRSILISKCAITGEPLALRLLSVLPKLALGGNIYELNCERMDVVDNGSGLPDAETYGKVSHSVWLLPFSGSKKITDLDAYPIEYSPDPEALKKRLIARGRKWESLDGIEHVYYKGVACLKEAKKVIRYNLNSRVMVDRGNFHRHMPNYDGYSPGTPNAGGRHVAPPPPPDLDDGDSMHSPPPGQHVTPYIPPANNAPIEVLNKKKEAKRPLTEDELLLTPANLFGFSLTDKIWLELNVENISPVQWNTEAFHNLVLPTNQKVLLQSLVEAHNEDIGFDDFIRGKGQGLVVNLFGPPGVGKTLSAEATSEHVKRPLYVVGASELGVSAKELDERLSKVFEVATSWRAIVLIDEADVFLEKRSMSDLKRNAMVAVFLRHLEYYRGILFLTTNRVKAYDDAFLSRIHVALRFYDLSFAAKVEVWTAFLKRNDGLEVANVSEEEIKQLAKKDINGREIKNAVRTAKSLAISRKQPLAFEHLKEVLEVMEQFSQAFIA